MTNKQLIAVKVALVGFAVLLAGLLSQRIWSMWCSAQDVAEMSSVRSLVAAISEYLKAASIAEREYGFENVPLSDNDYDSLIAHLVVCGTLGDMAPGWQPGQVLVDRWGGRYQIAICTNYVGKDFDCKISVWSKGRDGVSFTHDDIRYSFP